MEKLIADMTVVSAPLRTALLVLLCLQFVPEAVAQSDANILGTLIFESRAIGEAMPETTGTAAAKDASVTPVPAAGASSAGDAISGYRDAIGKAIEEDGLYSQRLSEQYEALGVQLYRNGQYDEAIEAFEDAMHIQKVNNGLFSLDQSRLVEYLILTHTARGDFEAVDDHRHYLYYLHEKSLDEADPRLTAAKLAWADWNVEAYVKGYRDTYFNPVNLYESVDSSRGMHSFQVNMPVRRPSADSSSISSAGTSTPETSITSVPMIINVPHLNPDAVITNAAVMDYNLRSIPYALSGELIVNQRLHEAEDVYEELLEQKEQDGSSLREQQALQEKLGNVSFLLKKELEKYEQVRDRGSIAYNRVNQEYTSDAAMMQNRRYMSSKSALTEIAEKIENDSSMTAADKARAYITVADMHLSYQRPQRAFEAYRKAYDILVAAGYSATDAARFMTPAPDTAVPGFGIHSYSREFFGISADMEIPFRGYIDLAFDKDRFGSVSGIRVLGSSPDAPQQVRTALIEYLRNQTFRPAFAHGDSINHDDIQLRYYYYY